MLEVIRNSDVTSCAPIQVYGYGPSHLVMQITERISATQFKATIAYFEFGVFLHWDTLKVVLYCVS